MDTQQWVTLFGPVAAVVLLLCIPAIRALWKQNVELGRGMQENIQLRTEKETLTVAELQQINHKLDLLIEAQRR